MNLWVPAFVEYERFSNWVLYVVYGTRREAFSMGNTSFTVAVG